MVECGEIATGFPALAEAAVRGRTDEPIVTQHEGANFKGGGTDPTVVLTAGMPLRDAWRAAQRTLAHAGIEDAAFDAAQLVQHVTNCDHRLHPDAPLTPTQAQALCALIQRRAAREPLQYLLGTWGFLGFTLRVGKGVLIPRADTEIVCETAIALARAMGEAPKLSACALANNEACRAFACEYAAPTNSDCAGGKPPAFCAVSRLRIVDLCAGSGAIAIGVARALPQAEVTAVELSDDAFFYLRENAAACAPHIALVKADVFTWQDTLSDAYADVLVANPPYIAPDQMHALAPELAFEPRMALEAAENGLTFYRHIARAYRRTLRAGGAMVLEIGSAQAQAVCGILQENGYVQIEVTPDAAHLPRCVSAHAPPQLH